jgi:hypothetical protein
MKASQNVRKLLSNLTFVLIASLSASAGAAEIAIEQSAVEPLPGRDYSMRLDLTTARFEQIDAQTGDASSRGFSSECAASLASGLWLAVPAATGHLELLPLGQTHAESIAVAAGCKTAADQAATLPPALLEQIAARGGGVIFVDNSPVDGRRIAAQEVAR